MKGSDAMFCLCKQKGGKAWKERFIGEEYDWNHSMDEDAKECPVGSVWTDQVVQILNEIETGEALMFICLHDDDCSW